MKQENRKTGERKVNNKLDNRVDLKKEEAKRGKLLQAHFSLGIFCQGQDDFDLFLM